MTRIFALAVPAWVTQQIAVRAFYARGEMWRPMWVGTVLVLLAVPLYLQLGERFGANGLAAAGALAMSANALATLTYARIRHGGPSLLALGSAGLRMAPVAALAAWCGAAVLRGGEGTLAALTDLVAGGLVVASITLAGAWWLGDAATRAVLRGQLARLRRRQSDG